MAHCGARGGCGEVPGTSAEYQPVAGLGWSAGAYGQTLPGLINFEERDPILSCPRLANCHSGNLEFVGVTRRKLLIKKSNVIVEGHV